MAPTHRGLVLRKHADTSSGERLRRYDPETGSRILVNPATDGLVHEPWPLLGVSVESDHTHVKIPTSVVSTGVAEGWIELEGESVVHRPGGPSNDEWRVTHTFRHADVIVFKTIDGDVRYRVTHQPDKYVDSDDPSDEVTPDAYAAGETRVDWFYLAELEG